jgi:hypothetical protein
MTLIKFIRVFTFRDNTKVFRIIVVKMPYSKPGEVTNHQILYCIAFFGIYFFVGLALSANSIHFLCFVLMFNKIRLKLADIRD